MFIKKNNEYLALQIIALLEPDFYEANFYCDSYFFS